MLTEQALRERQWIGLNTLQTILEYEYRDFENSLYVTSISDSEFDFFRRALFLAALVEAKEDRLIAAIAAIPDTADRHQFAASVIHDIENLQGALRHLEYHVDKAADAMRALRHRMDEVAWVQGDL